MKHTSALIAATAIGLFAAAVPANAFNPQPEPPKVWVMGNGNPIQSTKTLLPAKKAQSSMRTHQIKRIKKSSNPLAFDATDDE